MFSVNLLKGSSGINAEYGESSYFFAMLMPKKARVAILSYLFKEGVLVAKKDLRCKHNEIDVPNLYVIKLMLSMKSRKYVTETFTWSHYYWYLTNEGINYLREFLHLPEEIVPATLKKKQQQGRPGGGPLGGPRSGPGGPGRNFDGPRGPPRNFDGPRRNFEGRDYREGEPRQYDRPQGIGRGAPRTNAGVQ
eukprot:TRINITY_DN403_c0_g1_i10.p1 TRINITY_DN403_c0_g1~~TRINITY_DN403_c0_g1_i10.p1  ORF type:complete len:192 (+),score=30.78 TRINITY_DN403_c0_g1_i10:107-682(+)